MPQLPETLLCGRMDSHVHCQASCWRWRNFNEECPTEAPMHHPACPRRHNPAAACFGCPVATGVAR